MPRPQRRGKGEELTVSEMISVLKEIENQGKGHYGISVNSEYGIGIMEGIEDDQETVVFAGES